MADFLEVVDNLARTLTQATIASTSLLEGMQIIQCQFQQTLVKLSYSSTNALRITKI